LIHFYKRWKANGRLDLVVVDPGWTIFRRLKRSGRALMG